MNGDAGRDGLRQGLDAMLALELRLEELITQAVADTKGYLEAPTVLTQLRSLATGQRESLQAHLEGLGDTDVPPSGPSISAAFETVGATQGGTDGQKTIAPLRALAAELAQAAFAYAVLHALAHRSYHVATADLADEHRRNYLRAAQAIHQAVGDVAVQELQEAGHTCRCECPSCAPGICLCWHVHVDRDVTGPGVPAEGIVVRTPRAESNAERAGLRKGDVVLAVGEAEVTTYQDMLDRMREHEPGEQVGLRVRRATGEPEELIVTR